MPRQLVKPETIGDRLLARNLRTLYRALGDVEHWAREAQGYTKDSVIGDWLLELAEKAAQFHHESITVHARVGARRFR